MRRIFFSDIYWYYENLVELQEVKNSQEYGHISPTHQWLGLLGGFISQTCSHWDSSNSLVTVQIFLSRYWFPWRMLLMGFCSSKSWSFVFACQSLQFGGQCFYLCSHFSYSSKKCCWLFSLFSFSYLLGKKLRSVVRKEGCLPSFLHVGLEIGTLQFLLKYVFLFFPMLIFTKFFKNRMFGFNLSLVHLDIFANSAILLLYKILLTYFPAFPQ